MLLLVLDLIICTVQQVSSPIHCFLLSYHHHQFHPMSFPPIIDLQSFYRAKDESCLGTPGAEDAIKAAMAVINNSTDDIMRGHCLGDGSDMIKALLRAAFIPQADSPPPTPSVAPPQPSGLQGEAGTTNS
jgi:hypothetical protein